MDTCLDKLMLNIAHGRQS